uniref:MADS-box domain-containing protein n=1 Tax=Solanum lycopersicum TaxID=4081 RepID=A0A3Q7EMR2_SOLLC
MKETSRMVTFSKRRKGLFKKFSSIRCMELLISGPNYDFDSDSGLKLLSNSNS